MWTKPTCTRSWVSQCQRGKSKLSLSHVARPQCTFCSKLSQKRCELNSEWPVECERKKTEKVTHRSLITVSRQLSLVNECKACMSDPQSQPHVSRVRTRHQAVFLLNSCMYLLARIEQMKRRKNWNEKRWICNRPLQCHLKHPFITNATLWAVYPRTLRLQKKAYRM